MQTMNPALDVKLPTATAELRLSQATSTDEDLTLVHASNNRDLSASEQPVKRYDLKLLRIARKATHDFGDAQEVVQEAFLKVHQKLDQLRETARFSTWLGGIALNEAFMTMRKLRTREFRAKDVQAEIERVFEMNHSVRNLEDLCSVAELREILRKSLEELTPSLRIVFVLRDFEELSINETAEVLSLTCSAVEARLCRARLQLRNKLSKYFAKAYELSAHSRV